MHMARDVLFAWPCCGWVQKHGGAASCLVTGNLEPIGWGKMQALGIEHLFAQPQ